MVLPFALENHPYASSTSSLSHNFSHTLAIIGKSQHRAGYLDQDQVAQTFP